MTYYPYLRGRLYDLLALKELLATNTLNSKIIPIIEPVRDSKQLADTVQAFITAHHQIALIANPQVGSYQLNTDQLHPTSQFMTSPWLIPTAILAADFNRDFVTPVAGQQSLIIANEYRFAKLFQTTVKSLKMTQVLITSEARIAKLVPQPRIYLADHYPLRAHVTDYQNLSDEFFSDDHLYYQVDGYTGFSDYSLLGKPYFEHGFPSNAIALHLIYATPDLSLRVHHFVSVNNDQNGHQAAKFQEALTQLIAWCSSMNAINQTPALQQLLAYQKFPGLGTIKKLMLMHHLQLMGQLLDIGPVVPSTNHH